jgi:hypothetical protein
MKFLLTSKSGYVEIASPQGPRACFGSPLFLVIEQFRAEKVVENIKNRVFGPFLTNFFSSHKIPNFFWQSLADPRPQKLTSPRFKP